MGPASCSGGTSRSGARTSGTEGGAMQQFLQQVVGGLAAGGVYASLALALVLIYSAMGLINFAQGELAMFTTFIAWSLITVLHLPYALAVAITVLIAMAVGIAIERVVVR